MSAVERAVDDLDKEMKATFGLTQVQGEKEWLDSKNDRSYLRVRHSIRLAHHFDIEPALLIRDSVLGTLGIVELVSPGTVGVEDQVRRHVDNATYARHLLLRDYLRGNETALTVELVLLTLDDAPTVEAIGSALRDLQQKTESLFHVGVGLLVHRGEDLAFSGNLRRAFPWLLAATRKWFDSQHSKPPQVPDQPAVARRLARVSLSNYRLPGVRHLELARDRVHLVHGPNGSGKSALVEALEIITNGKVYRITRAQERAQEANYDRVIRNRGSLEPASVELSWDDGNAERREVGQDGITSALAPHVAASSFRLDQPLMERLVSRPPHERAQHFLEAFFPEALPSLTVYGEATKSLAVALGALRKYVEDFKDARRALENIKDWRGGGTTATGEKFPDVLNEWLERHALADLAQREHHVRGTLQAARTRHWSMKDEPAAGVLADVAIDLTAVQQQTMRWTKDVEELQKKLASFRPATRVEQEREGTPHTLTSQDCETLNRVGQWLIEGDIAKQGFGDKISRVIWAGDAPTFGSITIGREGWAVPLLSDLDAIIHACEDLATEKIAPKWPGKTSCGEYDAAAKQQAEVLEAGAAVTRNFLAKLHADAGAGGEFDGSLIAAINELMALFTPARWGYDDIELPSNLKDGALGLAMDLGRGEAAVRAELHLNTAELNMFTVALFLLCAGRVHKPLGLLVFDDPLQNMDELTSTALARGLAKLVRLWAQVGRRDELLLLFHGFDDLERFQDELSAATYRLPWLAPGRSAITMTIAAERVGRADAGIQRLDRLVGVAAAST